LFIQSFGTLPQLSLRLGEIATCDIFARGLVLLYGCLVTTYASVQYGWNMLEMRGWRGRSWTS
jgi:hypothetical protein